MLSDPLLPLVGGYLLWAALTALVALASWLFAAVYLPGHGAAVRWQSALLVATALVLTAVQGLGAVRALTRTSLALAASSLAGTVIVLAALRARRAARPQVPSLLARRDLALPGALAREAFTTREPLALAALAALVPLALSISIVVLLLTPSASGPGPSSSPRAALRSSSGVGGRSRRSSGPTFAAAGSGRSFAG